MIYEGSSQVMIIELYYSHTQVSVMGKDKWSES